MEDNKTEGLIDSKALPIPMLGKELGRMESNTFYLAEHEYGVLYHVYNSMDLIIRPNQTSAYETLVDLVRNHEEWNQKTGEEKEMIETYISAVAYVLGLPLIAFVDGEFLFKTATSVIELLQKLQKDMENSVLQEETPKENEEFKEATLALERIKEASKED